MADDQKEAGNDNLDPGRKQQASPAEGGDKGGLPEREWVKPLSEPLQKHPTLRKFTDENPIEQVARAYVELEGKLGKSVSIPEANASAEEWGKFFSRIGRPATADEYDVPADKLDKEFAVKLRDTAFKTGATKRQAKDFADLIVASAEEAAQKAQASRQRQAVDTAKALRAEFGDKYEAKMQAYSVGVAALFSEKVAERLKAVGFDGDEEFMRSMIAYGEKFGNTELYRGKPAAKSVDSYREAHSYMERYSRPAG